MAQTAQEITQMYRDWRKEHKNQKPNRVICKMRWLDGENTDKGYQVDTLGICNPNYWKDHDDASVMWWLWSLKNLIEHMSHENTGLDFEIIEVCEFFKVKH